MNEEVIPASGRGIRRFPSIRPISRLTQAVYLPVLRLCLKYRKTTLLLNLVFLVVTFPLIFRMGSQFMPPLFEGSSLYMPTALPGISITQATGIDAHVRCRISYPKWQQGRIPEVLASISRSQIGRRPKQYSQSVRACIGFLVTSK